MKYSIAALLVLLTLIAVAQNTFIKRYKNTTIAESGVAVCLLPNNQYAIVGQQANGFAWQAPMVVITDSAGNQIRHWVDTVCAGCNPHDAVADSMGYIYIAGNFYGKAGLAKYDTLGNQIWQRLYTTNGLESGISAVFNINDTIIIVGGHQGLASFDGYQALLIAYNTNGDTLWSIASKFGNTLPEAGIAVLNLNSDSTCIYATGVVTDTTIPRAVYIRMTMQGQVLNYNELTGRKWGYGIIPVTPNQILIGGRADASTSAYQYSYLTLVDSTGEEITTWQDSTLLYSSITRMDYDRQAGILYTVSFDTLWDTNQGWVEHDKVSAYRLPITSLQQPLWQKTITGTYNHSSFRGLKCADDGTVLQVGTADINCPNCPYLAKINEDACTDMACDTGFATGIVAPTLVNVTFKLYPNPLSSGPLYYELQSDEPIQTIEATCYDLSGKAIPLAHTENYNTGTAYKAALHINSGIANGMYIVKWLVNGRHSLYARFIKAG